MLGLDFIRAERAAVEKAIEAKAVDLNVDELLSVDAEVRRGAERGEEVARHQRAAQDLRCTGPCQVERTALGEDGEALERGIDRSAGDTGKNADQFAHICR